MIVLYVWLSCGALLLLIGYLMYLFSPSPAEIAAKEAIRLQQVALETRAVAAKKAKKDAQMREFLRSQQSVNEAEAGVSTVYAEPNSRLTDGHYG